MSVVEKIREIIEPSVVAMGYTLVLLKLNDSAKRKTLTVMAERQDDAPMSFDDCTNISQTVSALLEVDDPIPTAYNLEVCSPGLDRPLVKVEDYTRFAGWEIKLETLFPLDGRKRFRGVIEGFNDDKVMLNMPEGNAAIPYAHIKSARLAETQERIAEAMKKK